MEIDPLGWFARTDLNTATLSNSLEISAVLRIHIQILLPLSL